MFRNLPLAGSDTTVYEKVLGHGLNTRVLAIVNHKYVYAWKWSETGCCMRMSLANKPVNCVFLYDYFVEDAAGATKLCTVGGSSVFSPTIRPVGKRVSSSLVAPGINVFSAGQTTIACRPLTEFVYTTDDLLRESDVIAMDFSFAEAVLVCGCRCGRVRALSLAHAKVWAEFHTEDFPVFQVLCFENMVLSLAGDLGVCLWEISDTGLELLQRRERAHDCDLTVCCFCDSKRSFMTCDIKGFCRVWAVQEKVFKESLLLDHSAYGGITHAVCSQNEGLWVCASTDHFVRGWSVAAPLAPPTFIFSVSPCNVTAMAPALHDDIYIAADDRTIRLVNVRRNDERGIFVGHTQLIRQICVSPTATKFISLQWDGQLYFWLSAKKEMFPAGITSGPSGTARLPRLQKSDAGRSASATGEEPLISLYEKGRKTLLLKRREGERQLKQLRASPEWHKIVKIQQIVLSAIEVEEANQKRSQTSHA
jgi:WD40 repeat protein